MILFFKKIFLVSAVILTSKVSELRSTNKLEPVAFVFLGLNYLIHHHIFCKYNYIILYFLSIYLKFSWFQFSLQPNSILSYYIFIFHSIEGHLGCFCFPAIVNMLAMNIAEQYLWNRMPGPLVICQGTMLLGYMITLQTDFHSCCTNLQFHQQ